jgi:hypothetical protein
VVPRGERELLELDVLAFDHADPAA